MAAEVVVEAARVVVGPTAVVVAASSVLPHEAATRASTSSNEAAKITRLNTNRWLIRSLPCHRNEGIGVIRYHLGNKNGTREGPQDFGLRRGENTVGLPRYEKYECVQLALQEAAEWRRRPQIR
jgi:hypothetical protein